MDESEFITTIYKQGKSPKLLKILDEVQVYGNYSLKFRRFSLKRFAARLEKNPKKSEAITLIEKIDLHSVSQQEDEEALSQ